MRLKTWQLGPGGNTFVYGGDEVEASLWDVARAFSIPAGEAAVGAKDAKKRKRGDDLLPGEVWRAKNVPNDELSLRVPVHHTALAFLGGETNEKGAHLLAGTHVGAVRRYDTRAARKPVANWKGIVKTGAVMGVEGGYREQSVACLLRLDLVPESGTARRSCLIINRTCLRSTCETGGYFTRTKVMHCGSDLDTRSLHSLQASRRRSVHTPFLCRMHHIR
jgi:hypothetical protein